MIDMPTALVILGFLATVTAAIVKFVPSKKSSNNSNPGRRGVSEKMCDERSGTIKASLVELKSAVDKIEDSNQKILLELARRK